MKEEAAASFLRLAVPVVLLIVALKVPEPARLILLVAAVVAGVLLLKRVVAGWSKALRRRFYRQQARAENRREDAQIIDRYEQELKDARARYGGHHADPAASSDEGEPF